MRRLLALTLLAGLAACSTTQEAAQAPGCRAETFPVYFARDQVDLDELGRSVLERAAEQLAGCRGSRLEVAGYADPAGDAELNRRISSDRAHAVFETLLAHGVEAEQMEILAIGEAGARTADGRTEPMRRRVEVHFYPAGS